jgi:diguanylate cyclase
MSAKLPEDAAKPLEFLARHRLAATPQNYTLAYVALSDPGSPIGRAVAEIIAEGYRIKQDEADHILEAHGTTTFFGAYERKNGELSAHLRHQTIKIGELASSAADATGALARELSEEASTLSGGGADSTSIVARMIEHSLQAQARLTAAMDEVKTLREELEAARNDAQRDELTGLANRRAIDAHLAELAEKGEPRVIALCDIDHFKSVNDRYGHGVGDRVIKLVASTLEDACTAQFVGRWGGEEFIVIMPSSDIAAVIKRLNQARQTLADTKFKLRETDEPMGLISFSGGVALAVGGKQANVTALQQADKALYRAKDEGRNCILSA